MSCHLSLNGYNRPMARRGKLDDLDATPIALELVEEAWCQWQLAKAGLQSYPRQPGSAEKAAAAYKVWWEYAGRYQRANNLPGWRLKYHGLWNPSGKTPLQSNWLASSAPKSRKTKTPL